MNSDSPVSRRGAARLGSTGVAIAVAALLSLLPFAVAPGSAAQDQSGGPERAEIQRYFVLLESGQPTVQHSREELAVLQQQHVENLGRLYDLRQSPLAGPLGDGGKTRGIVVLELEDEVDREHLFGPDPFLRHGYLTARILPFSMRAGRFTRADASAQMAEYALVVVRRSEEIEPDDGEELCAAWIDALLEPIDPESAPEVLLAGTTREPTKEGARTGFLIFPKSDLQTLQERLSLEAEVAAGELSLELHPLWLGQGILDATESTDGDGKQGDRD